MRNVLRCPFLIGVITAIAWSSSPQRERVSAQAESGLVTTDFTGDPVSFSLTIPFEVFVNGKAWQGHTIGWHLDHTLDTGSAIWLGLPGQGMYILTLDPQEARGFQKAGAIHANAITFRDGSNEYEIRMSGLILGSDKTWTLYMLHRPDMEMKGPLFGVDRIANCTLGYLK